MPAVPPSPPCLLGASTLSRGAGGMGPRRFPCNSKPSPSYGIWWSTIVPKIMSCVAARGQVSRCGPR